MWIRKQTYHPMWIYRRKLGLDLAAQYQKPTYTQIIFENLWDIFPLIAIIGVISLLLLLLFHGLLPVFFS